jgi:aspartate/methionine/tyrosine aminotransferase
MSAGRAMQSGYMHWAKNQQPVRFHLGSSEVAHFALDQLPAADLEMDGASYYRYPPLRTAIAAKHGISPDRVVMADGASMANFLAMAVLIAPGDEMLVEQPAYEPLLAAASFLGARVTRFRRRAETGFTLDPAEVEAALGPRTRLIVLTNLHNPGGALADEASLARIGDLAGRAGAHVLVDEAYLDAAFAEAPRSSAHLGAAFVATGSLTKVYGLSGLRCGWILAAPDLAERIWRLNDLFGVSQAHQAERLACLAFVHLDEIAAGTPTLLDRNRALANAFFAARFDLDCAAMVHGITAFPRYAGDVDRLNALLRERYDTSIVPGRWFEAPQHFRIGVGGPTDMVAEGLRRLGAAMDELA